MTATCPRASSQPDRWRLAPPKLGLLLALSGQAAAALPEVALSIGELSHPEFRASGVELVLPAARGQGALLKIRRLAIRGRQLEHAELRCGDFAFRAQRLTCKRAALTARGFPEALALDLDIDPRSMRGTVALRASQGAALSVDLHGASGAALKLESLRLSQLARWVEPPAGWSGEGVLNGALDWRADRSEFRLVLSDGGFSDADGSHAGEKLALEVSGHGRARGATRDWQLEARWLEGAVYWQPYLLSAKVELAARWSELPGPPDVRLELRGDGFEVLRARVQGGLGEWPPARLEIDLQGAELSDLGSRFLGPWLDPANPGAWRFAGKASAQLQLDAGEPTRIGAELDRLALNNPARGLSVGPASGRLAWDRAGPAQSRLQVAGAVWRKLAFGGFELRLDSRGREFTLGRTRLPLLDGALVIEHADWSERAGLTEASAAAFVEPISMRRLSEALDLPSMNGVLSASVPTLRYRERELSMDGALVVSVFDGFVQATGLRAIEPLGRFPRLQADLEARNLDLGLLTDAFSFGNITGQIDATVADLELASWKPVRFDARIMSSPGNYSRRISQRAVQNIGALGGAGAALAIQRSFLGLFETFGYRRIGMSCRLRAGVCEMGGLSGADRDGGFMVVEGGGVPALNVIGYNRRFDWDELLGRIAVVINSNAAPVVR